MRFALDAAGIIVLRKGGKYEIMAGLLWTIIVILFIIWLISFVALHVTGFGIHVLLIVAVVLVVVNLLSGRRPAA